MPKGPADSIGNRLTRWSGLAVRLVPDLAAARRRPILVAGLARSGTTWVASVLGRSPRVKHFHEPFNATNVVGADALSYRYLPRGVEDTGFDAHCRKAFTGSVEGPYLLGARTWPRNKLPRWPGRILVKDVDVCLALEHIQELLAPRIVIVIRHPCALAASWSRLDFPVDSVLDRLRAQPRLMEGPLAPFERQFAEQSGFWQGMGLLWGACHRILNDQLRQNPEWIVVRHEDYCVEPEARYRDLFRALDLRWSSAAGDYLRESGTRDSGKPYIPHRVSAHESGKWRAELTEEQAADVLSFSEELMPLAELDAPDRNPGDVS